MIAWGVIEEARRRQRRERCAVGVAAVVAAGFAAVVFASSGAGGGRPRSQIGTRVAFASARGRQQAWFDVREPAGVILLAQIAVPHGARAYVDATTVGGAVRIATPGRLPDPSLSCVRSAAGDVCTQPVEPCPFGAAVWRLHVVKLAGPAGPVRVRFAVGPPRRPIE